MRFILAFIWLAALAPGLSVAAEVKELYRVETAARGRDETTRAEDLRAALNRVLKRLVRTGDMASGTVRDILAKPENYVLQFDYETRGEGERSVSILRVDFDPARLNGALRKRGIEVWGAERPEVLVWLTIRDKQGPWALASERVPEVNRILDELSLTTGLPVTLPLWDLADQQALSLADIEAGHSERIRMAAQRYETDTILAGRLTPAAGTAWEVDWRLYRGSAEDRWQGKSAEIREILASGMDGAYARLAAQSIPRDTATATLELRITSIESLDDANRVAAYLEKLTPVTRLEWLSVGTGDALFKIAARGGREVLRQTLNLGNLLRPAEDEAPGGSGTLTYRLAR